MYSRVTLLEIDTVRVDVPTALAMYRQEVLPALRQQPGYAGVFVMSTPDGKGLVMTLWDTEEAAEAESDTGFYADVLERFVTLYRNPPGRERYEVLYSETAAPVPG